MNKKLLLVLALITGSIAFEAAAQVHINVNIGVRPAWCPVGYEQAAYYYMPDIDAYYDVPQRQFIYLQGGDWVFAGALPDRYRNYDLYHCNKIMVNEPRPYLRNDFYRRRYAGYRGHPNERFISYGRNERYRDDRERSYEPRWRNDDGYYRGNGGREWHDRGRHHGHDRY
ncbi:hypothetical protein BH11BAC5_BH11BAC5_17810 [soil metagenome]